MDASAEGDDTGGAVIQNSVSGTKNTFKEIFCHVTVNSLYFEWIYDLFYKKTAFRSNQSNFEFAV